MARSQRKKRKRGTAGCGEAWMHLCRVESKLAELKKLASPDTFQRFVWELNEFIRSAKSVIDYLINEPGRGAGFKVWWKAEHSRFLADSRNKAFVALRDISEHDCTIVPREEHQNIRIAPTIEWTGLKGQVTDSETGEVIAYIHSADAATVEANLVVSKCRVNYYFENWPEEEILAFLSNVVANLKALVGRTYDAFPNGFNFHKTGATPISASSGN